MTSARFWWRLGQRQRRRQEKATTNSYRHRGHRTRAKVRLRRIAAGEELLDGGCDDGSPEAVTLPVALVVDALELVEERYRQSLANTSTLIERFDASVECREVTCLYNHVNWWIEDLIQHPDKLDGLLPDNDRAPDFFF